MDWLKGLLEHQEFWNILYILIGFFLGLGADVLREWIRGIRLRCALRDELTANKYLIDQKQDILNQMIEALRRGELLPGGSVPAASVVYNHHFPSIVSHLDPIERDNVRHIYATLERLDGYLETFETNFKQDLVGEAVKDAWTAYEGKLNDMHESFETQKKLIDAFLEGDPVDIYYRSSKYAGKKKVLAGPLTPDKVDKLRGL